MDQNMVDLPPGFRFHPSDEELITHYLCKKICDGSFVAVAVGDADLNKCEPWDLPAMAKMGENEWYFFCLRDKKYPTGLRTNRATEAGYWKATGKDKEIFRGKSLIGMKKTLVFYRGRAPKGQKSNWVMHEYRLEGKLSLHNLPQSAKTEWVISRVFEKSCGERKMNVHGVNGLSSFEDFMPQTQLPPLMDFSQSDTDFKNFTPSPNVSCFSNQTLFLKTQPGLINSYNNNNNNQLMGIPATQPIRQSNFNPMFNYELPGPVPVQDLAMARACFNYGREMVSVSQDSNEISSGMSNLETGRRRFEDGSTSGAGPGDLECLWPY